jgi:HD superfamily phosphohydrolase
MPPFRKQKATRHVARKKNPDRSGKEQVDMVRIADPVYGTLELTILESRIASTPAFDRLRRVKQLGLANYVYPGADYSRYSHCIGVCHLTGRLLTELRKNGAVIPDAAIPLYRVAGLLHDVGHYPLSHVTERAIKQYFTSLLIYSKHAGPAPSPPRTSVMEHEQVGKNIIERDTEISGLLKDHGIDPALVTGIIRRERTPYLRSNVISSDLDADRIDYLLRTAHHTGLPYGSSDLNYLLTQIRLDSDGLFCVMPNAMRTIEHFLLGRYFDYQQVAFHPRVAGLELVLEECIKRLHAEKLLDLSASAISAMVGTPQWRTFDDAFLLNTISSGRNRSRSNVTKALADAVIAGRAPRLVFSTEEFNPNSNVQKTHYSEKRRLEGIISELVTEFGISSDYWWVWDKPSQSITKIGSLVSTAEAGSLATRDRFDQLARILPLRGGDGRSKPIVEFEGSLIRVLSNYALFSLRLYVLLPDRANDLGEKIKMGVAAKMLK